MEYFCKNGEIIPMGGTPKLAAGDKIYLHDETIGYVQVEGKSNEDNRYLVLKFCPSCNCWDKGDLEGAATIMKALAEQGGI